MLRTSLILLLAVFVGNFSFAQPGGNKKKERREQLHAQKIAFMSTHLELTPEEAQLFWPVYNAYEAEIETVRKERRKYLKELKNSDNLSDDRAYELFVSVFESEKKESDIRLDYLNQFSAVLGKKKAANVFIAEEKFKRELLHKLKKDGPPRGNDGQGPPR